MRDIPSEKELEDFYNTSESELWNSNAFSILDDYQQRPDVVQRYYARERTKHWERVFANRLKRGLKVLDVGCSSGVFLATLRDRGFQVTGQDLSPQAVARGRETLNLNLFDGPLERCRFDDSFDVISCYDVIEHCRDPRQLIRTFRELTRSRSKVVIRTPNHASWLRQLTGERWLWYIPPAHIHYFTPASLMQLLRQEGFSIRKVRTGASTYLFLLAYYFLRQQTGAGSGKSFLDMPRWKERLIFGLDNAVRVALSPILLPARWLHADAILEVYARRN